MLGNLISLFSTILSVAVVWFADKTKLGMSYMVLNDLTTLVGLTLKVYSKVRASVAAELYL